MYFRNIEFDTPLNLSRESRYSAGGWLKGSLAQVTGLEVSVNRYRLNMDIWVEDRTWMITSFKGVRNLDTKERNGDIEIITEIESKH